MVLYNYKPFQNSIMNTNSALDFFNKLRTANGYLFNYGFFISPLNQQGKAIDTENPVQVAKNVYQFNNYRTLMRFLPYFLRKWSIT